MASLGQELRRERELRGISLREIADSTRISLRFLEAIEEDTFDLIPGAFFVRAILRSYARSIGIDEHQVLNRYQEIQNFKEQSQNKEHVYRTTPRTRPSAFSWKRIRFAAAAIFVIAIGLTLLFLFSLAPEKESSTLDETTLPANFPVVIPESPPAVEAAAEEIGRIRLRFDFIEETWLQVYADGEPVWDGIKGAGDSLEVMADREVLLQVGNAGGLGLTINGQQGKPLGPRGAVRTNIRITPENYRNLLASEKPDEG